MRGAKTRDEPRLQTVISDHRTWWRKLPRRVSVRALMIFILLLGGVLGWVVHLAQVQRDAITAIRTGGGRVTYDWQLKRLPNGNSRFDPKGRPKAAKWLLEYLGPDYFGHVEDVELGTRNFAAVMKHVQQLDKLRRIRFFTGIDLTPVAKAGLESLPNAGLSRFRGLLALVAADLSPPFDGANLKYLKNMTRLEHLVLPDDSSITDADLTYLSRMTALREINLHDPRITDAGFVSLKDMKGLKSLILSGTQVSGAGLKNLHEMKELKFLHLSRTPIDDRGLAPIIRLTGLESLRLDGTNVTGASYASLRHLSKVEDLTLQNTQVGDEGSAALAELTALVSLNLDDTRITDVTVDHLAGLPKLRALSLERTHITDRGLATLAECKALRRLNVRGTKISREGLRAFLKARPRVHVVH
jgi:hypothetical protein